MYVIFFVSLLIDKDMENSAMVNSTFREVLLIILVLTSLASCTDHTRVFHWEIKSKFRDFWFLLNLKAYLSQGQQQIRREVPN